MSAHVIRMFPEEPQGLDSSYESLIANYRNHPPLLSQIPSKTLTVLEVNFDAIAYNYLRIRSGFQGKYCAAVVKCDAYGIGASKVGQRLYRAGCRHFFVANLDEALDLRHSLAHDCEIFVFSGVLPSTEDIFIEHHLTPILIDLEQLKRWQAFGRQTDRKLQTAIHIDTGMNRTGLSPEDLLSLQANAEWLEPLDINLVLSHLACSPNPQHPLNDTQRLRFHNACSLFPDALKSLSSSEGVFLDPSFHYDMARPGLGLYGFNLSNEKMVPALRFWSRILHIHKVAAGESVGYGASHKFERDGKVAVLSAGYYHGWMRSLGNKGEVYIAGHKARIVGPISMDLCTVDVSDIPDSDLVLHGWVELSGQHIPMRQLAKDAGSITTEMLTLLSRNPNRLYVGEVKE